MSSHPLVPLVRTRVTLVTLAALTAGAAATGRPAWTVAALALTCLAIPLAVALAGGGPLLRDLLWPSPRRGAVSGLAHTAEERERFVT